MVDHPNKGWNSNDTSTDAFYCATGIFRDPAINFREGPVIEGLKFYK